jgi:CRP-like cAMP-binding protein
MYSTLEITKLLKSVSLFAEIPGEKLAKIAAVTHEIRMSKGGSVMREGESGDSLFIVADGVVRVHKAGQDLALLKKGDCVGEMALLDRSPRSADVTVEEDAALLRIGREDFNALASSNPEILQGIVRLLARRLREANEKLAALSKEIQASGSR